MSRELATKRWRPRAGRMETLKCGYLYDLANENFFPLCSFAGPTDTNTQAVDVDVRATNAHSKGGNLTSTARIRTPMSSYRHAGQKCLRGAFDDVPNKRAPVVFCGFLYTHETYIATVQASFAHFVLDPSDQYHGVYMCVCVM